MVCLQALMNNCLLSLSLCFPLSLPVCFSLVLTVSLKQVLTIQAQLHVCCWFLVKQKTSDKRFFCFLFFVFPSTTFLQSEVACLDVFLTYPISTVCSFEQLLLSGRFRSDSDPSKCTESVLREVLLVITRCYGVSADSQSSMPTSLPCHNLPVHSAACCYNIKINQ